MVSGVNLPAAQLQVAIGLPLRRIRDIRQLYCAAPASSEINFDMIRPDAKQLQRKPRPKGHVVAVRIARKIPTLVSNCRLVHYRNSILLEHPLFLPVHADSQFGHVFACGEDRSESQKNMIVALKELSVRGDFRTTMELLTQFEVFKGEYHYDWLA
jgi:acetyl-CoA carboxylase/biotin carboxylase 1